MAGSERFLYQEQSVSPEKFCNLGISFGSYFPRTTLTNRVIESWRVITKGGKLLTADAILHKTGIEKRYVANDEETPLFMAIKASEEALKGNKEKIDVVIVSTSFPTGENLSGELQKKFGLSGFHLDVHAACSGVGISLAYLKRREGLFAGKKILLVTTEKYSPYLQDLREEGGSAKDPSLAQTLFSDGAIACKFEYGKDLKVLSIKNYVFSENTKDHIKMPIDRNLMVGPYCEIPIAYPQSGKFEQEGSKVYKLVRNTIPNLIKESISKAGHTQGDIKMVFLHQGSGHVVTGINDQLPEFQGRILMDYQDGNNSSGSVLKCIMKAIAENTIKKNDIVNLTVFGAGMRALSATLRL